MAVKSIDIIKSYLAGGKYPTASELVDTIDTLVSIGQNSGGSGTSELATVATTGDYNDLSNKPTIPTVPTISTNITNDATSDTKTASPKAVKDFVEGKGYLTEHQDLSNYYTKAQINEVINGLITRIERLESFHRDESDGIHTETTPANLEAVDLGLPSGTLWANMNVGATAPEEVGDYYAWGETETKDSYTWDNYICTSEQCGSEQDPVYKVYPNGNISGTEFDTAHIKWGGNWVMPTLAQTIELVDNTTVESVRSNDVLCLKLTSKINNNSILLQLVGTNGFGAWSSQLDTENNLLNHAWTIQGWSTPSIQAHSANARERRYSNKNVRPVINPNTNN